MSTHKKISFSAILRKSIALSVDNISLFITVALIAVLFFAVALLIPVFFFGFEGIKSVFSYSMGDAVALNPALPSLKIIALSFLYCMFVCSLLAIYWTGLIRITFDLLDKGASTIRHMWVGDKKLFSCVIASCILLPLVVLGLCCLIVPGIYIALSCMFYGALIIDRDVSPVESLKASYALTNGYRWQLFWWIVLCSLLGKLFGALAFPVCLIGTIMIYRELTIFKSA